MVLVPGSTRTYEYAGAAVKNISELELYSDLLPQYGILKYTISRNAGSQTIAVPFIKNGSQLAQSAFRLTSLSQGSTQSIYDYPNDDHDTLVMLGNGEGLLSRTNTNTWTGNYDNFRANSNVRADTSLSSAMPSSLGDYLAGGDGTVIAFPQTNTTLVYKMGSGTYATNVNGTYYGPFSIPTEIANAIGSGSPTNSLMTLSDGVSSFQIGRWGSSITHYYIEVDLTTGQFLRYNSKTFSASQTNGTEEDSNGTQLFAVNAYVSYLSTGNFRWNNLSDTPSNAWRWATGLSGNNSATVGSGLDTQYDMDIFGSIDNSNYVWFADWGHDNGGIFQVGNDNILGVCSTTIYMTPSTYTE